MARDPLILKITEAVEGTLFDVRPPPGPIEAPDAPELDDEQEPATDDPSATTME